MLKPLWKTPPEAPKPSGVMLLFLIILFGMFVGLIYVWVWSPTLRGFFAAWAIGCAIVGTVVALGPVNRFGLPVLASLMAVAGALAGAVFPYLAGESFNVVTSATIGASCCAAVTLLELRGVRGTAP
jgi:hypothetical protein